MIASLDPMVVDGQVVTGIGTTKRGLGWIHRSPSISLLCQVTSQSPGDQCTNYIILPYNAPLPRTFCAYYTGLVLADLETTHAALVVQSNNRMTR